MICNHNSDDKKLKTLLFSFKVNSFLNNRIATTIELNAYKNSMRFETLK